MRSTSQSSVPGNGGNVAFITFMDDARWVGSDGCNVTSGHWAVGPEGLSLIGDGGATQRGCLEPAQDWVVDARRAVLDDGALTLFDAAGKRTGRLQRAR